MRRTGRVPVGDCVLCAVAYCTVEFDAYCIRMLKCIIRVLTGKPTVTATRCVKCESIAFKAGRLKLNVSDPMPPWVGMRCVLSDQTITGYGNNASQIAQGRRCDSCNFRVVLQQRLRQAILSHASLTQPPLLRASNRTSCTSRKKEPRGHL